MRFLWIFALIAAFGLVGCLEPQDDGDTRSGDNNEESDSELFDPGEDELTLGGLLEQQFDLLQEACLECAGSEAGLCFADVIPMAPLTERQEACLAEAVDSDDPYLECVAEMAELGTACFEYAADTCKGFEPCASLLLELSSTCPAPDEATLAVLDGCYHSTAEEVVDAERLRSKEMCACDEGVKAGFVPPQIPGPPIDFCEDYLGAWTVGERGCVEAVLDEALEDEELREDVQAGINCMNEEFSRQLLCYENSECGTEEHHYCMGRHTICGLPHCEMPESVFQDMTECMGCLND